ncbi:unnamed protein product [Cylindrotheca closterium]|uniref:SWIRM domain-containing protein n=1 Tax=Cylindrotheca closterium TaxID=2856 RepID=A0AAD2CGF3_9STRA|nr:unnamed protein product [Cylindrotheca closterium]
MSSDSSIKSSKKKGGSKKGSAVDGTSLIREEASAMDCQNILTGFYGARGERIKHTVARGALNMPKESIDIIDKASEDMAPSSSNYKLPGLDSVSRSMVDAKLRQVVITELTPERVTVARQLPQPPQVPGQMMMQQQQPQVTHVKVMRTRVQNRVLTRTVMQPTASGQPVEGERIRGGGDNNPPTNLPPVSGQVPHNPQIQAPPAAGAAPMSTPTHAPSQQQPGPAMPQAQTPQVQQTRPAMPGQQPATQPQTQPPQATPQPQTAHRPAPSMSAPVAPAGSKPMVPGGVAPQARPAHPPGQVSSTAPPPQSRPVHPPGQVPSTAPTSQVRSTHPTGQVPSTTPSATVPPKTVSSAPQTKLIPTKTLNNKPRPQWNQHKPGPNDETVTPGDQLSPNPDWYKSNKIADLERTMLPEWFDASAPHRTPEKYIKTRERVIAISKTVLNRNVTNSMIRRSIEGDAGSLHRLRTFLINWGFINEDSINDSAPTPAILRQTKRPPRKFDESLSDNLITAIVQESKKRKLEHGDTDDSAIDWDEVAKTMGQGVTGEDCERNFLSLGIKTEEPPASPPSSDDMAVDGEPPSSPSKPATTPKADASKESLRQEFIKDLIDSSNPAIVKKVTNAALKASEENVKEAQGAAVVGLIASRALEQARAQEDNLSSILSQLVNKRMEKLENRMAMIDDVEGILEAEKVALELERRDLYTARCRYWYGDA